VIFFSSLSLSLLLLLLPSSAMAFIHSFIHSIMGPKIGICSFILACYESLSVDLVSKYFEILKFFHISLWDFMMVLGPFSKVFILYCWSWYWVQGWFFWVMWSVLGGSQELGENRLDFQIGFHPAFRQLSLDVLSYLDWKPGIPVVLKLRIITNSFIKKNKIDIQLWKITFENQRFSHLREPFSWKPDGFIYIKKFWNLGWFSKMKSKFSKELH